MEIQLELILKTYVNSVSNAAYLNAILALQKEILIKLEFDTKDEVERRVKELIVKCLEAQFDEIPDIVDAESREAIKEKLRNITSQG